MRAAAGSYGEGREEQPADEWLELPPGVRIRDDMFVAVVQGRSMEPLIPDKSLCLFRRAVVGSRQNRVVLVRRVDETGSAGEITVKRYRSEKAISEEGFQHTLITMVPENPEFPQWTLEPGEQLDVIGEFIQVVGPAGDL